MSLLVKDVSSTQVIFEVKDLTLEDIAFNPIFSNDMKYITVTRGAKHHLTVVNKDGSTFSLHWGGGSHTLISEDLKRLRDYIIKFAKDNLILLDSNSDEVKRAETFYNSNFNAYQLNVFTASDKVHFWFDTEEERSQYIERLGLTYSKSVPNPLVDTVMIYE